MSADTLEKFEKDIELALGDWVRESYDHGVQLWSALTNTDWIHSVHGFAEYGFTFRQAGGFIAELRGDGEDYMTFYCAGPAGTVSDHVRLELSRLGWTATPTP